uniref:Uncharacterized protein n=1 Tax=Lotus japonicus TaxID=34305 RepID=I3TAB2_LOTJA|nr:unknown [Lotus japonicus]
MLMFLVNLQKYVEAEHILGFKFIWPLSQLWKFEFQNQVII